MENIFLFQLEKKQEKSKGISSCIEFVKQTIQKITCMEVI